MTYAACGIVLDTDLWLPELEHAGRPDADCTFHLLPEQDRSAKPTSWTFERSFADGHPWLSVARHGTGYLLRFSDLADFLVTESGRAISCVPLTGTPIETVRHLLLDQVLPLVLTMFGRLVLHAGAVEVDGKALVFLGPSGAGKSTLVGALCERGATVLADDCVVVEEDERNGTPWAIPSYAGLRLWPASVSALYEPGTASETVAHYTNKRRVVPTNGRRPHHSRAVPITGFYLLDPVELAADSKSDGIAVAPLVRREACMELIKSAFQLDVTDAEATCRSFEQVGHLASICSISRLQYVRDFNQLQSVVDAVLADHRD